MHGRTRTEAETRGGWRVLAAAAGLLAVLALGPSAGAQDGADPAARDAAEAPAQPAEEAEPAPPPAPAESAPPRAAGEASDDVFVPTEEIAADEEVVFPVDI